MKRIVFILVIFAFAGSFSAAKDSQRTKEMITDLLNDSAEAEQKKKVPLPDKKEGDDKKQPQRQAAKKPADKKEKKAPSAEELTLLRTGERFFNDGIYSQSERNFKELLEKFPAGDLKDQAHLYLGRIYIKKYNYDEAVKELSQIQPASGEYIRALYHTAESYMLKREYVAAIDYYNRTYQQNPTGELADKALLNMARLYLNIQKGSQALDALITLIKQFRERETVCEAYYTLAKIYEKDPLLKDFETARVIYKIFLKKSTAGVKPFSNSPLRKRVKSDLDYLEKRHFRLEN